MSNSKQAKKFVKNIFIYLFLSIILYVSIYNTTVKIKSWGVHSFKNYLLESTKELPRIIIDSGSNSHHGINSRLIEEEFHRITINLADNGGYPLRNKLLRIANNSVENDIVILPLEYMHYSYQSIPKVFYDEIFGALDYYYYNLDFIEKLKFISKTPFSSLLNSFSKENKYTDNSDIFSSKFESNLRGDYEFISKTPLDAGTKNSSCEVYTLMTPIINHFVISDTFKDNLKLIKKIEENKKIKIIITYPSVTGNNCYEGVYKNDFKTFIKNIKSLLKENDIALIGEVEDSNFKIKYMNNTYYHLLPSGRDIRTKRLIKRIKESKYNYLFQSTYH